MDPREMTVEEIWKKFANVIQSRKKTETFEISNSVPLTLQIAILSRLAGGAKISDIFKNMNTLNDANVPPTKVRKVDVSSIKDHQIACRKNIPIYNKDKKCKWN